MRKNRRVLAFILAMIMMFQPAVTALAETGVEFAVLSGSPVLTENSSGTGDSDPEPAADQAAKNTATPSVKATSSEAEKVPFEQSREVDGVVVTVRAEAGVFPKNAELSVKKVTKKAVLEDVEEAVEEVRDEETGVAGSYTYDIKVLCDGREIEPEGEVQVSFALAETVGKHEQVNVYHVSEDEEGLTAEFLETDSSVEENQGDEEREEETVVTVETDGFSYYVVEFTYDGLEYVLEGGASVKLSVIQETLDLEGVVTSAASSNGALFTVEKDAEGEDWTVTARNAFTSEESLTVRIGDKEYIINVADDLTPDYLTFTAEEANSIVYFNWESGSEVQYQLNNGDWQDYVMGTAVSLPGIGNFVRFRGLNVRTGSSYHFSMEGKIAASGSVTSLTDKTGRDTQVTLSSNCYDSMFSGCHSLTSAPKLPAVTLAENCYSSMFSCCWSLVNAPQLPAMILADSCYSRMFYDCRSLTTAPTLPATELARSCYLHMFDACSNLKPAPALPAMTLAYQCYCGMFYDCIDLRVAPALPATTLAGSCYAAMFSGCYRMTDAPQLPATTLADSCYSNMFSRCSGLTTAPALPATILAGSCYAAMFSGCSKLTEAPTLSATNLGRFCYSSMFSGCISLATAPELPAMVLASGCYQYMFCGCLSLIAAPELPATNLAANCYCSMFENCCNLVSAPFVLSATALPEYCYYRMFNGCTNLTNAPEMPATAVSTYCCYEMFNACTSLVNAPSVLPATTLADYCYDRMFYGCESLTDSPSLPATTLAQSCYNSMFYGCESLTEVQQSLPAMELASLCYYQMFSGCSGLTAAPALPATALEQMCYLGMFCGCSNLTEAPALPAKTLASWCYHSMFYGCTGLTTVPELPATNLEYGCYNCMFANCTGLTRAPELPATTLKGTCYQEMFRNCTGLTVAPKLPAKKTEKYCYNAMFAGCTGLQYVPQLPATWLEESCYAAMFKGCTGLILKNRNEGEYISVWKVPASNNALNWNQEMFYGCYGVCYGAPALNTEYYQKVQPYTVTFNNNGHGQSVASALIKPGELIPSPAGLTETGLVMTGWYREPEFINLWNFATDTMPEEDITLYAKWEVAKYTITFDSDGGSPVASITQDYNTAVTRPADPTKAGYTFAGWNPDVPKTIPEGDITLKAQWTANTNTPYTVIHKKQNITDDGYTTANTLKLTGTTGIEITPPVKSYDGFTAPAVQTETIKGDGSTEIIYLYTRNSYSISFDMNGHGTQTGDITARYEAAVSAPASPSATGYAFGGWYTDAGCTDAYVFTAMPLGGATVYAKWTANRYSIEFDANGGSGSMSPVTEIAYDSSVILPASTFSRTGYVFSGWAESRTGNVLYGNRTSVKNLTVKNGAAVTLYAVWTLDQYTITFNTNGGSTVPPVTQKYGTKVTQPADPTRTGYDFGGWHADAACTHVYAFTTMPAGGATVYAKWIAHRYSIRFNANGGTGTMSTITGVSYGSPRILTANKFTRTGYTFAGWATKSDGSTKYPDKASVKNLTAKDGGAVTLYAVWTLNRYTISFMTNGGSTVADITQGYGTKVSQPADPTRTGYTFAGWYADEACTKGYTFTTMPLGGATVYAKWTAHKYSVRFNANGGSGTMSTLSGISYGSAKTLPANKFSRTGYTFAGWSASKTGNVKYKNKASVKNLTSKDGGSVTLYAVWTANKYTVTYDSNNGSPVSRFSVEYNMTVPQPGDPVKPGYTFDGWDPEVPEKMPAQNIVLKAKWTPVSYKVKFNGNGAASGTMVVQSRKYDDKRVLSANTFTKKGYSFTGWNTKADGSGKTYADKTTENLRSTAGTTTLYAQWKVKTLTVTLKFNDGETKDQKIKVTYGKTYPLLPMPEKEGSTFAGWSFDQSGYDIVTASTKVTKDENHVLYAQWNEIYWKYSSGTLTLSSKKISDTGISKAAIYDETHPAPWHTYAKKIKSVSIADQTIRPTSTAYWFDGFGTCSFVLSKLDTSEVTDMNHMFSGCTFKDGLNISTFVTDNVTDMSSMFENATGKISFGKINTENVTDMSLMFRGYQAGGSAISLDLSRFSTKNVLNMTSMFEQANISSVNIKNFDTRKVTGMAHMFNNCTALKSFANSYYFTTEQAKDTSYMFNNCHKLTGIGDLDLSFARTTDTSYMFHGCKSLTAAVTVTGSSAGKYITDATSMFDTCGGKVSVTIKNVDFMKLKTANRMFAGLKGSICISGVSMNAVTDMTEMFKGSNVSAVDLTTLSVKAVKNMNSMFAGSTAKTIDISGLKTDNVTDMSSMFSDCANLTTLKLAGIKTAKVKTMRSMFDSCEKLTVLDVSSFNTAKVTDMYRMFYYCQKLKTIKASDSFVTGKVTKDIQMFQHCNRLAGQNGTEYTEDKQDKEYARIDLPQKPGYFTKAK